MVDRNGVLISRNVKTFHAGIDPKLLKDKKNFLIKLRINFPNLPINKIEKKLNEKNIFELRKELTRKKKISSGLLEKNQLNLNLLKLGCTLMGIYLVI